MKEKNKLSVNGLATALSEKRYPRFLFLALSAVIMGLTLVFPNIGALGWVGMIPLGMALASMTDDARMRLRGFYGYGLFYFMCFGVVIFHWFVNLYPLDFVDGMTKGSAIVVVLSGCLGLSLFQAAFGGLLFVAVALTGRTALCRRYPALRAFFTAALWAVYEWTQTLGWIGVPWGRLALGQTAHPIGIGSASLLGSYFITFMLVFVNMLIALALTRVDLRRATAALALGVIVFHYGAGAVIMLTRGESDRKMTVAAIQGNISSNEKWDVSSTERTYEIYARYTREAAEAGAELVVFPETAFPYTLREGKSLYKYFSDLSRETGIILLAGCFVHDEEENEYNSIVCFTPEGEMLPTFYAKRHLVPFGEFVPMREFFSVVIPPLVELTMLDYDILEGEDSEVFELDTVSLGSLICFDSIYDPLARDSVRDGAELICLSTNDSWFTDSAALRMHNAQAKLRAAENGRAVVRAANTGISTIISHTGAMEERLDALVEGYVIGEVELREGRTLYNVVGNVLVYVFIIASVVLVAEDKIRGKIKK